MGLSMLCPPVDEVRRAARRVFDFPPTVDTRHRPPYWDEPTTRDVHRLWDFVARAAV